MLMLTCSLIKNWDQTKQSRERAGKSMDSAKDSVARIVGVELKPKLKADQPTKAQIEAVREAFDWLGQRMKTMDEIQMAFSAERSYEMARKSGNALIAIAEEVEAHTFPSDLPPKLQDWVKVGRMAVIVSADSQGQIFRGLFEQADAKSAKDRNAAIEKMTEGKEGLREAREAFVLSSIQANALAGIK
jgi:hypothetical protein